MSRSPALDLLGVLSPSMSQAANPQASDPSLFAVMAPAAGGAIAGVALGARLGHPLLGLLAGEALGANATRLWRGAPGDRARSLTNLGAAASGIAGSLIAQRYSRSVWAAFAGWLAGFVAGQVGASFVEGSNAHRLRVGGRLPSRYFLEGNR